MALILRESDVQELIEMDDVIAAVEAAMRELGEGEAQNEPRRRAFAPGGLLNVMFAAWPGGKCTGLKAYTVANGRVRFMVVLFGLDGSVEALVESDFMGAYRTGAATAVAVKALGLPASATVALIGCGWQASTQALALTRVLQVEELRVFSRNAERRAAFAAEQAEQLGIKTVDASTAEAAVRGADIVVTVTTSHLPVLEAAWVEPHALVVAVGSNFRNRVEVPTDLVERAQTVVVDQLAADQHECGTGRRVDDPRRRPGGGKTDHQVRPVRATPGFPGLDRCPDHPADVRFGGRGWPSLSGFIFHVRHLHYSNAWSRLADRCLWFFAVSPPLWRSATRPSRPAPRAPRRSPRASIPRSSEGRRPPAAWG